MRTQRVILAWSEVDLDSWHRGDVVVPLTPEAHVAAFRIPAAAVLDPKDYLGDPGNVADSATQVLNSLHETLKMSPFPWLEAYANIIFQIKVFQLIAWLGMIRSLRTKFRPLALEICPPKLISDGEFVYRVAQQSFDLAHGILRREGVRFSVPEPSSPWKTRLLRESALGRAVAYVASKALRSTSPRLREGTGRSAGVASMQQHVDVVLVSQQYTDAFHAAPLALRLAKTFGGRFAWISRPPRAAHKMTSEEVELLASVNIKEIHFVDSALLEDESNTTYRRSMLVDLDSAWKVAGVLVRQTRLRVTRDRWVKFLMDSDFRGFAIRYEGWCRYLDEVRPKVVVGLSTLQDMALVRAWARHRRVPFVEFMHGAFPAVDSSYQVDADYLGVFGRIYAEQLKKSHLPQPRRVMACGAMQFGDKLSSVSRERAARKSPPSRTAVLFLGGFDWLPFCPWSPADMWTMLRDIHMVCCQFDKVLRVRLHPRNVSSGLAPYVHALAKQRPESIVLSSEPSIQHDLDTAVFVMAAGFDGAVLDALLDRQLVLSYVPKGVKPSIDSKPFEIMGTLASGYEALTELFAAVVGNSDRATELRRAQDRFVKDYVGDLDQDPWTGALSLVDEALRESSADVR